MTLSGSRSEEEEEATSTTLMHLFLIFQLFIASVAFLLFWYIHGEVNKNLPRDCYILYYKSRLYHVFHCPASHSPTLLYYYYFSH